MNIFYDNIIFELQRSGGISLYWSELIKRQLQNKEIEINFLETRVKSNQNIFRTALTLPESTIITRTATLPLKILRYLNVDCNQNEGVFHSSYYRNAKKKYRCRHITTVHDFIYERYMKGIRKSIHSWQKYNALKRADGIICVSESTKSDLLHFYPHFSEKAISVIYNGVSEHFKKLEKRIAQSYISQTYKWTLPFILFVGSRNASYKNFELAVKSSSKSGYGLVLIGGGNLNSTEASLLKLELEGRYLHLQYISQFDFNMFYNTAHCLLYPSACEGFGLPLVEALRAGCPVVAGNHSSVAEIVKNRLSLIENMTIDEICQKIKALEDLVYREMIIQEGFLNTKKFSWDLCYRQTLDFYKQVLSNN